ncbi:MAG TPA: MarR family winged helix-turn-helix transcriptional regulator [Polyangiales bacterium]|nr:MarR family winged helix-turn-helix transcriptional regulator [Polyangiales bacterium]
MPTRKARKITAEATLIDGDNAPPLGPVLDFLRVLWAVDHGLNRISKRMETEFGVTGPQRLAIRIIGRFPWITAGGLAGILHVHPSTLTGVLHRLEVRKLLVRRMDASDGRRTLLGLTLEGKRCDARRLGTIESIVEQVLSQCTRQQVEATSVVLTRIAAALQAVSSVGD